MCCRSWRCYLTGIPASVFRRGTGPWAAVAGRDGRKDPGILEWLRFSYRALAGMDDERVWDVQCAGDEFIRGLPAGDGTRWGMLAESVRETECEKRKRRGWLSLLCADVLGRCAWGLGFHEAGGRLDIMLYGAKPNAGVC